MTVSHGLKICIAGKNEIAVHALRLVLANYPDSTAFCLANAVDGGYDTWQPSLKKYAVDHGVPVVTLEQCYVISDLIFLSLEFDKIIKPDCFSTNRLFNIHFSKLPAYKGMYTSALPLLHGEKESGVTLHRIERGIDTGPIIDQIIFNLDSIATSRELYFRYLEHAKVLLANNLEKLVSNVFDSQAQSSLGSSYYSKNAIDYKNIAIDLKKTAHQIKNQIRAFTFREYQIAEVHGFSVNEVIITADASTATAGVLVKKNSNNIVVATIDYDVVLIVDKSAELLKACCSNDIDLAATSLDGTPDVNYRNGVGWSPLIVASYHGAVDVMRYLLNNNADVNLGNYKGTTPLMFAMSHYEECQNKRPFDLLLHYGADITLKDYLGKTIHDYAVDRNVTDLHNFND